jgi:hypothetical protein
MQAKICLRDRVEDRSHAFGPLGMMLSVVLEVLGIGKERDQAGVVAGCGRRALIASRRRRADALAASA